jgi:hypothetical protein
MGQESPDNIRIEISWPEWEAAVAVGISRHRFALLENRTARWREGNELQGHIRGALGEQAFMKWLGLHWTITNNAFKMPDCVGNIQIRSTAVMRPYHKVLPEDPGDQTVVFLESGERVHYIKGCILVADGQKLPLEDPGYRNAPCHRVFYEHMKSAAHLYDLAHQALVNAKAPEVA